MSSQDETVNKAYLAEFDVILNDCKEVASGIASCLAQIRLILEQEGWVNDASLSTKAHVDHYLRLLERQLVLMAWSLLDAVGSDEEPASLALAKSAKALKRESGDGTRSLSRFASLYVKNVPCGRSLLSQKYGGLQFAKKVFTPDCEQVAHAHDRLMALSKEVGALGASATFKRVAFLRHEGIAHIVEKSRDRIKHQITPEITMNEVFEVCVKAADLALQMHTHWNSTGQPLSAELIELEMRGGRDFWELLRLGDAAYTARKRHRDDV